MVPKIIHNIVGPVTNDLVDECLASWEILKKYGFKIKRWTDDEIEKFIRKNHFFALNAFKDARNHAEAADIARYLIIYTYGGFYADWDIQLLDPGKFIRIAENYLNGYLLIDPPNHTLASEFFCAQKEDPFLYNLSCDITDIFSAGCRAQYNTPEYSGPFRMRDSLLLHPETRMVSIPVKEMFAYDYREIRNPPPGAIHQPLIHYWMHSWVTTTKDH